MGLGPMTGRGAGSCAGYPTPGFMNPMPGLDALLEKAKAAGIFGTKMRSVIKQANAAGIKAVVDQQFDVGRQIVAAGLVPIIEPEVDIHCPDKAAAEDILHDMGVISIIASD